MLEHIALGLKKLAFLDHEQRIKYTYKFISRKDNFNTIKQTEIELLDYNLNIEL